MTEVPHTYPHGVPCWIDVEVPDPEGATSFYGGLFGWTFETVTPPGVPPYAMARLDGADVAGVGVGDAWWSTYVAVDDADVSAAAVRAAGGAVTAEPEDAGPGGRGASCTDPTGLPFRLWQARRRLGAQVVNVPNAWNFSNLAASDPALEFYATVFGWRVVDTGMTAIQVPGYGEHLRTTVDPDILVRQANAPDGFEDVVAGVAGPDADGVSRWDVTFTATTPSPGPRVWAPRRSPPLTGTGPAPPCSVTRRAASSPSASSPRRATSEPRPRSRERGGPTDVQVPGVDRAARGPDR